MSSDSTQALLDCALAVGKGVLRIAPTWVPRSFSSPGRRLKLHPQDLYALGADRGGICERWFASTTNADNGPGTPADEGLSYIYCEGETSNNDRVLLKEAIQVRGSDLLGQEAMARHGGWKMFAKFFDNAGPLPHHLHHSPEKAREVNREGKPEAYYFPPQLNFTEGEFPYTFFGLEPGATREDVISCLKRWNEGDNGILYLSKAYRLKVGTGWDVPPGILHAPGSLVTYEPQMSSDVAAMFQSLVGSRPIPRELLIKDIPKDRRDDFDYLVDLIDWDANVDPEFMRHRHVVPTPVAPAPEMEQAGYREMWVTRPNPYFSAKELTVFPGRSISSREEAAYGLIVVQGRGSVGPMDVESPTLIRFGELTRDELFVTKDAAAELRIVNTSDAENLVLLKHFGPA